LVGKAGFGKGVILKELYTELSIKDFPILALKSDMKDATNLVNLSKILDFKNPINKEVNTALQFFGRVIVIIDQIDALSQYMSKDRKYLNCYLELIKQLLQMNNVRIIISCREFDLAYDRSLNSIKYDKKITVSPLRDVEVNEVLKKFNLSITDLQSKMQKIIKIPNNLFLFCKIYHEKLDLSKISTPYHLFNELWRNEIALTKDNVQINKKPELLYKLTKKMTDKSTLNLARSPYFDDF
jgi:hypothetical protein